MEQEVGKLVEELVAKARKAQREFESFSQEQVDAAVRAIGKVVYDRAEELSRMKWPSATASPSVSGTA